MALTLEQITDEITNDNCPTGPDYSSCIDRIAYIQTVLEMPSIDLTAEYDFTKVIGVDDVSMVEAAKHLAILRLEWFRRLYENFHLKPDEYRVRIAPIMLDVQRINWHLAHLKHQVPTPPYSPLN